MDTQTDLLRQFVKICKANPAILHDPKYAFYREYLESLGATIPPMPEAQTPPHSQSTKSPEPSAPEEENEEPMEDEPPVELDMSGVISGESDDPLPMGDQNKQVTDDDLEKAGEQRDLAMAAFSDGDFAKALEHYTNAIELNPGAAMLHAKRANVLLKLNKPNSAIRDCDKAISLNPDSAQGYKFRGRAHRLLGNFLEAHRDLATACKLDYDDVANEWLKEVEPNAKKLLEHNRAKERRAEEQKKARRDKARKAHQEARRAADQRKEEQSCGDRDCSGEHDEGAEGMGMPFGFDKIFKDPEILSLLKEKEVMDAYADIMKNPANIAKHQDNPKVLKLFEKIATATGAPFPGMKKPDTGSSGGSPSKPAPSTIPMPDLD